MRVLLWLSLVILTCNTAFANLVSGNFIENNQQITYLQDENKWSFEEISDNSIVLVKKLMEGTGCYSVYNYADDTLAFALASGTEFIQNGRLVVCDNNTLSYSEIVYKNGSFMQVPMEISEIQTMFPQAEILRMSQISEDNRVWLHKPLFKKKIVLLVNDTDRYFYKLTCSSRKVQNSEISGLLTFSRYGFYKFTHFGERNGQLIFYVR